MGVAVQKGAGQGILRGDGALGQIGGGQSGQQLHNGKAAARFGDRHAQQGRHLAERVWYGTGNGKGCLLYTSPSPRDLSTSRMPSSA